MTGNVHVASYKKYSIIITGDVKSLISLYNEHAPYLKLALLPDVPR